MAPEGQGNSFLKMPKSSWTWTSLTRQGSGEDVCWQVGPVWPLSGVRLWLWVCGRVGVPVWLCVCVGSRHAEPQTFSLSKLLGMCVPKWPSLCVAVTLPWGDFQSLKQWPWASRRQGLSLLYSPALFPATAWYRWMNISWFIDTPSRLCSRGFNFASDCIHGRRLTLLIEKCIMVSSFWKDGMTWNTVGLNVTPNVLHYLEILP